MCLRSRDRVGPKAFLKSRTPFTPSPLILSPTHSQDLPRRWSAYLIQSHPNPTDQNPAPHYCKPQKQSYESALKGKSLSSAGRQKTKCMSQMTKPKTRLTSLTHSLAKLKEEHSSHRTPPLPYHGFNSDQSPSTTRVRPLSASGKAVSLNPLPRNSRTSPRPVLPRRCSGLDHPRSHSAIITTSLHSPLIFETQINPPIEP
jgi:hypothetical protein